MYTFARGANGGRVSRYERFAMILDPGCEKLGGAALGLIARGIDPLYAGDVDEALLLLAEERRVGALVLPGTLSLATFDAVLDRIASRLAARTAAVVVVAPPRERTLLRALRDRNIRWVVRTPFDGAELRFAVAAALASEDELDVRSGLRVPIRLPARLEIGGGLREAEIRDLSFCGAYMALPEPPPVGELLSLELAVGDRRLRSDARVVHCLSEYEAGRAEGEPGIGVHFQSLGEPERRVLECFVQARIDSFRL